MAELTPLMRQYWDIKTLHPGKILLFRMGDFFEIFHEDAKIAAPILGIALTSRNKKSADETPMCGVPHHSISGPINKLLTAGFRVAICDQIEDPKFAKGIVKRAVTRILTPGMVYDSEMLPEGLPNYMASLDLESLACIDTSSGEAFYIQASRSELVEMIRILPIAELVLGSMDKQLADLGILTSLHEGLVKNSNVEGVSPLPASARRLLSYCQSLAGEQGLQTIRPFEERKLDRRLQISPTVIRHLEIFQTYMGDSSHSFFSTIDRTKTSAGKRSLRNRLCFPWTELETILSEQKRVEAWVKDSGKLKQIRDILAGVGDMERRLGRIGTSQASGRDLVSLGESLRAGIEAERLSETLSSSGFSQLKTQLQVLDKLCEEISSTIVETPPLGVRQGYLIKSGVSPQLDEVIFLSTNAQTLLQEMEEKERKSTGISSLKIRYNNVFGYYIEVTHTHKEKIPSHYLRKQTLANAERFYTDELIELEKKVLSAQTRRFEMEYEIFETLRQRVLAHSFSVLQLAKQISDLDVSTSFAWLMIERNYCLPELGGEVISLGSSRHPVVEHQVGGKFVANDIFLNRGDSLVLTGPNMAGKSTLMRQVALSAILAQMGGPVPATEARLPLFDALYTRIGASDQLSQGLSTFMVEMTETAEMIQNASPASLVILDEVGRGTSTYDGLSLAQAILEYFLENKKCYILFATHYHELTSLDKKYPQLKNAHMSIGEKGKEIQFLHTLRNGPAGKSYGIQVARLAGIPIEITKRASEVLQSFEGKRTQSQKTQMDLMDWAVEEEPALSRDPGLDHIIENLRKASTTTMTPLQALNQIAQWQEILSSNSSN